MEGGNVDLSLVMPTLHIVTCRPVARERADKHFSTEMDSWKPIRHRTRFRGYG
jgi:hypothetical protein